MASIRVFVSSTYYDLKHIRSSLEVFIESLGYDAALSEKGNIAYSPDQPLDESCYREVKNCDIYILIIGGRYGSESSETRTGTPKTFFERYESVTKMEYKAAASDDIPIYILIERAVYAEYQTFLKNRDNKNIAYAHVDSVNVFHFIDSILSQPRNNPIQTFDKYVDIETWLRLQWSGLFRELLKQRSSQAQLRSLAAQVQDLSEVNKTLRRYLEEVVTKVAPQLEANSLIQAEDARLTEAHNNLKLASNDYVEYLTRAVNIPLNKIREALEEATTLKEFVERLEKSCNDHPASIHPISVVKRSKAAFNDLNEARKIVNRPAFAESDF